MACSLSLLRGDEQAVFSGKSPNSWTISCVECDTSLTILRGSPIVVRCRSETEDHADIRRPEVEARYERLSDSIAARRGWCAGGHWLRRRLGQRIVRRGAVVPQIGAHTHETGEEHDPCAVVAADPDLVAECGAERGAARAAGGGRR